ncbi:MAG: hypothetical protein IKV64_02670 [Clostridia bacterium]|nr:hypothetical protein [Clostridia bacterium]
MSKFIKYNANPAHNRIGDCTVRAISTALNQQWEKTYLELCIQGLIMFDLPNADYVWGQYLKNKGFKRNILPCDNGICITVEQFCYEHPNGIYLLCPKNHIIAVINGKFYDTWNSGQEILNYYWKREED